MSSSIEEVRGLWWLGEDFALYIEGVDEINLRHDSILFEACNTSFQVHLQIDPNEFADRYNWAQVLAGPVLAISANSPLLFGKELAMLFYCIGRRRHDGPWSTHSSSVAVCDDLSR